MQKPEPYQFSDDAYDPLNADGHRQRFFTATLQDGGGGPGRAHLEEALRRTEASPFPVFERTLPLKTAQ